MRISLFFSHYYLEKKLLEAKLLVIAVLLQTLLFSLSLWFLSVSSLTVKLQSMFLDFHVPVVRTCHTVHRVCKYTWVDLQPFFKPGVSPAINHRFAKAEWNFETHRRGPMLVFHRNNPSKSDC